MRLRNLDAQQLAAPLAVVFTLGSLSIDMSTADAKTVQIPETRPQVLLDVPDDWTVSPIRGGFELRSPDKTSIVIVGIVKRAKPDVIAWNNMATSKMIAFGVKFDPKAVAPPPSRKPDAQPAKPDIAGPGGVNPEPATSGGPSSTTPSVSAATATSGPGSTVKPDVPAATGPGTTAPDAAAAPAPVTVFSGAPSIALPEEPPAVEIARDAEPEPTFSLDQFNATATLKIEPRMTFKAAFLYGATLDGKPVDAQFFNFGLSKDAAFLLQQESTPADNRAVDIAKSVRRAS